MKLLFRSFLGVVAIAMLTGLGSPSPAQAESRIERLQELVEDRPLLRAFLIKFYKWKLAKYGEGEGGNDGDMDDGAEHGSSSPH